MSKLKGRRSGWRWALIAVVLLACLAAWLPDSDYNQILLQNWGISLPSECRYQVVYSKDSGPSFHGDGIRYHVFSLKQSEPVEQMSVWQAAEGETVFAQTYTEALRQWLDALSVPDAYRPEVTGCMYTYAVRHDNSELLMLWSRDTHSIYVAESFL